MSGDHNLYQKDQFNPDWEAIAADQAMTIAMMRSEKQEPVAWMTNSEQETTAEYMFSHVKTPIHDIPLYIAPPQREWVGLTDDEIMGIAESSFDWNEYTRNIEAKLKEKNVSRPVSGLECDCPYLKIHDAVVRDNDKANSLLEQCFDEMGYAGWNKPTTDYQGQLNVFNAVLDYLHPPEEEKNT